MGIRELIGEVDGKKLIDVGDIVNVFLKNKEVYGRLNASSTEKIRVGSIVIKIDDILKITKQNG